MTMTNVISLAERRIERAKARRTIGQCSALANVQRSVMPVASGKTGATQEVIEQMVDVEKMTPAALSRWHLMQEAIDEFLLSGQQFHIGDIVNQVNEWEKMLNNGKA